MTISFSKGSKRNSYTLDILDTKPYGRPNTYLSSHCLLTALSFYNIAQFCKIKSWDNTYTLAEFVYAALHHDDGKSHPMWQKWFTKNKGEKEVDFSNYKDHADSKQYDTSLHQNELEYLRNANIEVSVNQELAKWAIQNHHPHKAVDAMSLRTERTMLILADHLSASIESMETKEEKTVDLYKDILVASDHRFGNVFSFYRPDFSECIKGIKITINVHTNVSGGNVF